MKELPRRIIMGIDPGTNTAGYGFLEVQGRSVRCLVLGDIALHALKDPYRKLRHLFDRVGALIEMYHPDEVALESPFFGENVQSMLKLGRAQGVAMAAALTHDLPVFEYAPRRIKQAITGRGSASKEQVAALLKSMLHVEYDIRRLDATDGLAVAMCHYFLSSAPINEACGGERKKALGGGLKATSRQGSSSWESFVNANPDRLVQPEKTKRTAGNLENKSKQTIQKIKP